MTFSVSNKRIHAILYLKYLFTMFLFTTGGDHILTMVVHVRRKYAIPFLLSVLLVTFAAFLPAESAIAETVVPKLTLLVYMTGSDLESIGGSASMDIEEMVASMPSHDDLAMYVMAAGSTKWMSGIDAASNTVYQIKPGSITAVHTEALSSMGDAQTLSGFLNWAWDACPSERYALIIWDHGAGPLEGVCFDENFRLSQSRMDSLSLLELQHALMASPFRNHKLSFIGFDACLMGSIEVACTVQDFAEMMIASQEPEPASGWNYAFLKDLNGTQNPADIGRLILDYYNESLSDTFIPATLCCIDLESLHDLMTAFNTYFSELLPTIGSQSYKKYASCRAIAKTLGNTTAYRYDLVDLTDLIQMFQEAQLADGSEVLSHLENTILYQVSRNIDHVHGLSLYFPFDNPSRYLSPWAETYRMLNYSDSYLDFMQKIMDLYLSDTLLDWKDQYQTRIQESYGGIRIEALLTEEEIRNIVRSRLIVMEEVQEGSYLFVYYDDKNVTQNTFHISARYHGEALYETDQSGNILSGPLDYFPIDGGVSIYGIADYVTDTQSEFPVYHSAPVRLIYLEDEEHHLVFSEIMTAGNVENDVFLPSSLKPEQILGLTVIQFGIQGSLEELTSLDYKIMATEDYRRIPQMLSFLPVQSEHRRLAYLRMTTVQGETLVSDCVEVPNPTLLPVVSSQQDWDWHEIHWHLSALDCVSGYKAGLICRLERSYDTDTVPDLSLVSVQINSQTLNPGEFVSWNTPAGHQEESFCYIPSTTFQRYQVADLSSLGLSFTIDTPAEENTFTITIPLSLSTSFFLNPEETESPAQ